MKKPSTFLALTIISGSLVCCSLLQAQPRGFDAGKLAMAGEKIQSLIDDEVIAGAVVLVARNGHVALHEARGTSNIKTGEKMKKDTIFRIYSMTKPITTTAIMMLIEEGKLAPSDPVKKYIPSFSKLQVYASFRQSQANGKPNERC